VSGRVWHLRQQPRSAGPAGSLGRFAHLWLPCGGPVAVAAWSLLLERSRRHTGAEAKAQPAVGAFAVPRPAVAKLGKRGAQVAAEQRRAAWPAASGVAPLRPGSIKLRPPDRELGVGLAAVAQEGQYGRAQLRDLLNELTTGARLQEPPACEQTVEPVQRPREDPRKLAHESPLQVEVFRAEVGPCQTQH